MKSVIWLLLPLILCICGISCNEHILSQFHQNVYKMKDFRIELMSYKDKFYNFANAKTFKFNRTTPTANITWNFKISTKDKVEVVVQVYKFLSNEYRHFPIRFQVNLKKAFDSNAIGLQRIKNCGNVTEFYFEKDVTYHMCNFVIDETRFPPLIPNGRFKVELQLTYLNEEIAVYLLFVEIYTPIPYPKNGK